MKVNVRVKKNIVPLIVMKRRLNMLAQTSMEVGFFSDKTYGPENDNLPVAQVAFWQERGTYHWATGEEHIPARPFFLTTIDSFKRGRNVSKRLAIAVQMFLIDRMSPIPAMKNLGEFLQKQLQDSIERWSVPPNAKSTVDKKGFNNPLIETGFMKDSVAFRVIKRGKQ